MNIAINQSKTYESTLIWAIICSVLLHGLFAVAIDFNFDEVKAPEILEVELVKKPEPPPVTPPEPIPPPPPEVVKPEPKPLPKPIIKPPLPTPVVDKIEPIEQHTPPPPPEVIAVAPKEAAPTPTHVVPTPAPVKQEPMAPSQADLDGYSNSLWSAISKHKKYPKIAQMRGWQGEVIVELQLDGNGKIKSKKIAQSSGYEVLDKQALEMVEKALPFPIPPETLRSSNFTITVPVPFKLE